MREWGTKDMASPGQLRAEKRIRFIESRIDRLIEIADNQQKIISKIIDKLNIEEFQNEINKSENGAEPQPASGHGAENVEPDDSTRQVLTHSAYKVAADSDENGGREGLEPGQTEEGGSGRGDKVGVEDKELCETDEGS
jgi:hypothetical protein